MKIEKQEGSFLKKISDINIGETFIYKNQLCLKIDIEYCDNGLIKDGFNNAIVNLETNHLNCLRDWVEVQTIPAKIII